MNDIKLPNGYVVKGHLNNVVLAYGEGVYCPWVTWSYNDRGCYFGHYFTSRDKAQIDFFKRCNDAL